MKENVSAIIDILKNRYPDAPCALHYQKDYELMIAVRLSAQCTDARVNLVTPALFEKYPGTVLLAVNGHEHKDHLAVVNGIAYFDVNTTNNGYWEKHEDYHYEDTHTFRFTDYDENGDATTTEDLPLNNLRQGKNTWFFTNPLSAIVTVTKDGQITIEGENTEWLHGIEPPRHQDGVKPAIESRKIKL